MGHLIGSNIPLSYRIVDATIKKGLSVLPESAAEGLKKRFVAKKDLSEEEQMAWQQVGGMVRDEDQLARMAGEAMVHTDPKYEVKSFGRVKMPVAKPGTDRLTLPEE